MHEKWRQMPPLLFLRHDGKMSDLFIELQGITKRFPGVVANDRVDLTVHRGEIHAIVGENGAGKSTLMRVLYGLYQPDEGTIAVKGHAVTIESPRQALELGIGMVHQHFMLIPVFTVAENVILGSEPVWGFGRLRMREAQQRVAELCRQYGFVLDPTAEVGSLSVGEQQRVEIIKVLYRGAELLILDEPTAVLVAQEVDELFNNLRQLVAQGKTVIFISHKLDEVLAISDQITVLRRGRVVGTVPAAGTTKAQLAEMMVGRPVLVEMAHPPVEPGPVRLDVRQVRVPGRGTRPAVRDVSFAVGAGEIYGIAGVEGNGQTELVEALVGLRRITGGQLLIDGRDVTHATARAIRLMGVAHIPEDRHRRGIALPMAVWENMILGHHTREEFTHGALLNRAGWRCAGRRVGARRGVGGGTRPVHDRRWADRRGSRGMKHRLLVLQMATPVLAILFGMLSASVIILAIGLNPLDVYAVMVRFNVTRTDSLFSILFKTTPLIFAGLAVALSFRVSLFNI